MKMELLNTPDDLAWLKDVHCRDDFPPEALSAMVEGNEDAPTRIQFFHREMPSFDDDPVATVVFDEARSEAMAIIANRGMPQIVKADEQEVCRLYYEGGRYRMDGYSRQHSLADHSTDLVRLTAHWRQFRASNTQRAEFLTSVPRNGP